MKGFIETVKSMDWADIIHLMGWVMAGFVTAALFGKGWS